jgi:hypothetical protein
MTRDKQSIEGHRRRLITCQHGTRDNFSWDETAASIILLTVGPLLRERDARAPHKRGKGADRDLRCVGMACDVC